MRRREFITLLGSTAAAWPLAARSQQPEMPVIGLIGTASPAEVFHLVAAFRQGLKAVGFVEGQNVLVEYRWAENQYDRLPALAADLVHRQVQVIVATSTAASWMAAKAATVTIPIVFQGGGDPVKLGLVASLSRPGGNATGVINMSAELTTKRLEILRELVPAATQIAVLTNPDNPTAEQQLQDVVVAARTTHQEIYVVNASNERSIDEAFATVVQRHAGALFVIADSVFTNRHQQLVALAARQAVPAIYAFREFPAADGLISYGANLADEWRKTGIYAGRILKGDKPPDLPVIEPTKFELVINLKTAKALGLSVPPSLLLLADEVIE
jgi:putative tryptophan/tyrosine transport system substrate-binding protein